MFLKKIYLTPTPACQFNLMDLSYTRTIDPDFTERWRRSLDSNLGSFLKMKTLEDRILEPRMESWRLIPTWTPRSTFLARTGET